MTEVVIRDVCKAYSDWGAMLLRYFNPAGAHLKADIGEEPQGTPNNLMPYVSQAWLPDGYSQIFRSYVFGPSGFWTMAPLRYGAKFDPFLS